MLLALLGCLLSFVTARTYQEELAFRGIPPSAKQVLIISQSAHLDYDWLNWFPTNVNNTPPDYSNYFNANPALSPQWTNRIFASATSLLQQYPEYHYSVCEMSFLQAFQEQEPQLWSQLMR